MLRQLSIENFALIDKLTLEFGPGLNVLTGETGAGKSIIIDAIGLLLGSRASQDFLRSGSEKAVVSGVFELNSEIREKLAPLGLDDVDDDFIFLSRELSLTGKNVCRVNGKIVPLSMLKKISSLLVDICGQHEYQKISSPAQQLTILDEFGGEEIYKLKNEVAENFRKLKKIEKKIVDMQNKREEYLKKQDFLQYQLEEINAAQLKEGEEEEIEKEIKILSGAEFLAGESAKIYGLLFAGENEFPSAYDMIGSAVESLRAMSAYDGSLEEKLKILEDIMYTLQDVAHFMRDYGESKEYNPERLRQLEERLTVINRLKQKYKRSVEEILQYRDEIAASLDELYFSDETLKKFKEEKEKILKVLISKAQELEKLRIFFGKKLSSELEKTLRELEMKDSRFVVKVENTEEINEQGMNNVEFLFSANPGEPLKSLSKVASGGELSRLMLALKSVQAKKDSVPVLIFDEVDAGIGGSTAFKIGEKIAFLSQFHQIICVTHSPQVAAFSHQHFEIVKEVKNNRTTTNVIPLSSEESIREIARMLGGKDKDTAVEHAKRLVCEARLYRI
ncbi:MAG TPA: DNA repair protein RecN [Peptococcaceae bacterium]|nr:MAG: DNA repair protein RecN [Clostridia bacterium 41_269]HBT20457.1 DNA repair protein RecN [Peptococcaceae bacterium]